MRFFHHRDDERGAAAIEMALVGMLLVMIAFGATEYGLAMKDWLSVSSATREGARVGAAAGDEPDADCRILEAAAGGLQDLEGDEVIQVWIYETDNGGAMGDRQRYRPSVVGDDPVSLRCSGEWFILENGWVDADRDNDGSVRDWIGVRIFFDHDWLTGFLWWSGSVCSRGTVVGQDCWQQETIMHIEPDPTP